MYNFYARPNADSYTESFVYKTKIFGAINGVRKTEPMMEDFLYRAKYTSFIFYTSDHRAFINMFRQGLTDVVVQPLWGQSAIILETLTDTTTIPCVHEYNRFVVGEQVFITDRYDGFNVVTLVSKGVDNLIVSSAVDIVKDTIVCPSFIGIISGQINTTYSGENYAACEISVEEF